MKKLKVGLYGSNGHQVDGELSNIEEIDLVAVCGLPEDRILHLQSNPIRYDRYEEFLKHPGMELVSICSPFRSSQYEDIKAALSKGLHVYAEKPFVMDINQLDELIKFANMHQLYCREMSSTVYQSPYSEIRTIVASGQIGDVIQVFTQKSYPYADWRPQSEEVDGGLILQAGIHAVRLVEQTALRKILSISAVQTQLGNPVLHGKLGMAASFQMQLENGAVGSAIVNYLNFAGSGIWGNDHLRIFGTKGYIESIDGGKQVKLVIGKTSQTVNAGSLDQITHFHMFVREILGVPTPLPSVETELRSLRIVLKARNSALRQGEFIHV